MNPRIRKLIGAVIMVVFVALYALVVAGLAPRFLDEASTLTKTLFYLVAGLAWTLPLLPLIRWMEAKRA